MLIYTISHPHIASAPRRRCIKDARGIGCGEGGRWTVKSVAPRGRRDVDANASDGEWFFIHKKINRYQLTLLLLHIVVEGTTEMCVLLVYQIANNRGCCGIVMGAAVVMVNLVI